MFFEGILTLTVVAGCYAECYSSKCTSLVNTFNYLSCVDYNACLLNKDEGGCTREERDKLLPSNCRCYVSCGEEFRNAINSRQTHFCYYRGVLEKCMTSNPFCLGVSTYLLNDFQTKCPCKVENCLTRQFDSNTGNVSCVKYLGCLSGGPVSKNYAGCASAKRVRQVMAEKNYKITNQEGTWILNKDCRCVNKCAKEELDFWPGCGPAEKVARCYLNEHCSIEHIKPYLTLCACEDVCKTEISSVVAVANSSLDVLCNNYRVYGNCMRRYGCTKRDLILANNKRLNECPCFEFCDSGSRLKSFLSQPLTSIFFLLFITYILPKY